MLWLKGLMGLMAVGPAACIDTNADKTETDRDQIAVKQVVSENEVTEGTPLAVQIDGDAGPDRVHAAGGEGIVAADVGKDDARRDTGEDRLLGEAEEDTAVGSDRPCEMQSADVIAKDAGDGVQGGGADQIVLGDWATDGPAAAIDDFAPEEDSLLFVWDDTVTEGEPPEVNVQTDPDNDGQLQVWMGDQIMAQISGASPLTEADIALVPLSSAQALELIAA